MRTLLYQYNQFCLDFVWIFYLRSFFSLSLYVRTVVYIFTNSNLNTNCCLFMTLFLLAISLSSAIYIHLFTNVIFHFILIIFGFVHKGSAHRKHRLHDWNICIWVFVDNNNNNHCYGSNIWWTKYFDNEYTVAGRRWESSRCATATAATHAATAAKWHMFLCRTRAMPRTIQRKWTL